MIPAVIENPNFLKVKDRIPQQNLSNYVWIYDDRIELGATGRHNSTVTQKDYLVELLINPIVVGSKIVKHKITLLREVKI